MDYVTMIKGLILIAMNLWKTAKEIKGESNIPSWEDLTAENKLLQEKIEKEKEGE